MIIGISGKIGSGKDTVAKIIQLLTAKDHERWPQELEGNFNKLSFYESDWKVNKFAYKLKQMVALLIGCNVEQLEDQDFKNTPLGKDWDFPEDDIAKQKQRTPRLLLQLLGTECGRDILHPNVWVNALFSDYKGVPAPNGLERGYIKYPNWIITDVRFPNEARSIKQREGILIRLERDRYVEFEGKQVKVLDMHPSETSLDDYKFFDYRIDNNGTIDQLVEKIREILIKQDLI